jgi:hypothetical protein
MTWDESSQEHQFIQWLPQLDTIYSNYTPISKYIDLVIPFLVGCTGAIKQTIEQFIIYICMSLKRIPYFKYVLLFVFNLTFVTMCVIFFIGFDSDAMKQYKKDTNK